MRVSLLLVMLLVLSATEIIRVPVATAQPAAEKRVALVVGIQDYTAARKLKNPVRDARGVEGALRNLGFSVRLETELSGRRLVSRVAEFAEDNRGADVVLFYFGGHGVQIGGRNYLLPIDATAATTPGLTASSLLLDDLVATLATVAPRRILLLDACRNDPFGDAVSPPAEVPERAHPGPPGRGLTPLTNPVAEGSRSDARPMPLIIPGLGRIGRVDGAIVAFATEPGSVALDGDGEHSPFAEALIAHLGKPGIEFHSALKLVQMDVYDRQRGRQLPYVEDALPELFFADTRGEPLPERDRLLLAMAKIAPETRAQVERIAVTKDVPLAPLYGALLALEAEGTAGGQDAREKQLIRSAEEFAKVRTELAAFASADPEILRLRVRAQDQLALGAFDTARATLTQAIQAEEDAGEVLRVKLSERDLSRAASLVLRATMSRSRGLKSDYLAAADDYAAAAALAAPWEGEAAVEYYRLEAMVLAEHGARYGDKSSFKRAAAAYHRILRTIDDARDTAPENWADAQYQLGDVLLGLGTLDGDVEALREAVGVYRTALLKRSRERDSFAWATTKLALANALATLGEQENGTSQLEEAVAEYRAALEELKPDSEPADWGNAQVKLGLTLHHLAWRSQNVTYVRQAVAAYRSALSVTTRARNPERWEAIQNNIEILLTAPNKGDGDRSPLEPRR